MRMVRGPAIGISIHSPLARVKDAVGITSIPNWSTTSLESVKHRGAHIRDGPDGRPSDIALHQVARLDQLAISRVIQFDFSDDFAHIPHLFNAFDVDSAVTCMQCDATYLQCAA